MITIVRWFVRVLLGIIFIDWFLMRYNAENRKQIEPAGMVMVNINTQQVCRVAFGCSAEDLHEGDVLPMEIRLIDELDNTKDE